MAELDIQLPEGGWTRTLTLFCPKLSQEISLSWITQKKLKMLHKGWPFSTVREHSAYSASMEKVISDIPTTPRRLCPPVSKAPVEVPMWPPAHFPEKLQELCKEYEDVLVTELEANQQIQCPKMEVKLKEGTKAFFA